MQQIPHKPALAHHLPDAAGKAVRTRIPQCAPVRAWPEPVIEPMRGPKLVIVWVSLIALSWAIVLALGYGLYHAVAWLF